MSSDQPRHGQSDMLDTTSSGNLEDLSNLENFSLPYSTAASITEGVPGSSGQSDRNTKHPEFAENKQAFNGFRVRQKSQHYVLSPELNSFALQQSIDKKFSGNHFANKSCVFKAVSEIGTEAALRGFELFVKFSYRPESFSDFIQTIVGPVQPMVSNLSIEFRFNDQSFFINCSHG